MKKLMIAAAATAMIGGAFATQVADYKATVKCVYMKEANVKIGEAGTHHVYLKYVGVTSLNGYVVYGDCACNDVDTMVDVFEVPYTPAYLVVRSFAQTDTLPKIFPADLLVKIIDTRLGTAGNEQMVGAEGYLFAGCGKGSTELNFDDFAYPWVDSDVPAGLVWPYQNVPESKCIANVETDTIEWYNYDYGNNESFRGVAPWMANGSYSFGKATFATRLLFGKYNDAASNGVFYDSWLDHAGFGTAQYDFESGGCDEDQSGTCLEKLQGYLIGGLFICHPNGYGYGSGNWEWFRCQEWLGTTDVVAGYWAMKKNRTAYGTELTAEDGAFYNRFYTGLAGFNTYLGLPVTRGGDTVEDILTDFPSARGQRYLLDYCKWLQVRQLLPYLKACCAKTGHSLGDVLAAPAKFGKDKVEATTKFLTAGACYPGVFDYRAYIEY